MKTLLFLVALATSLLALAGEDETWSKPDHELRARLFVLPSDRAEAPFCRVYIELENIANVMGQRTIDFSTSKLELQITDQDGKALEVSDGQYDGMSPIWKPTLLPFGGSIKFRIDSCGLGYRPEVDKVIVDVVSQAWVVPQAGTYYLSGKLTIPSRKGDHPHMDWSGSLTLPKVEIPKAK